MSSASAGLWTRNLNCAHQSNKLLSGGARVHSRSRRWRTYGTDPSFRFAFRKLERRTRIPDLDCEPARIDRRGIVDTFPHEDKADLKRTPPYAKGRRSPIFTNSFHRNGDGAASRKGTTAHRNQASADHPGPGSQGWPAFASRSVSPERRSFNSYFACISPATTSATLSSIWSQPSN
jgi:hypothetical protein